MAATTRSVAELALDAEGQFLAVRLTGTGNMGAYLGAVAPLPPTINAVKNMVSIYRTPLIEVSAQCVFTNTSPVSAYRGAGRPEGNYFMERLIDTAAAEMGIDRLELRRRNQLKPKELPYAAASDQTYDSGDFPAVFKDALELADWKGFAKRKRESKKRGRLRGIAVGSYLEVTAPPNKEMGGIRFEPDGTVTFITGTLDYGQGHATPFAQVLSSRLGVPFDRVRLLQGDSDELIAGGGTGGSRSSAASTMAMVEAIAKVVEQGKVAASHVLEASPSRHRVRQRPLHHRRHRPLDRRDRACREAARRFQAPRRCAEIPRRETRERAGAVRVPQWLPRRRSRDRSRDRRRRGGEIHLRQ